MTVSILHSVEKGKLMNPTRSLSFLFLSNLSSFLIFFIQAVSTSGAPPQKKPPILIGLGEQKALSIPGLQRFSIGSPIVRALSPNQKMLDAGTLLIKGLRAGRTDLWVWKQNGEIHFRTVQVQKWKNIHFSPLLLEHLNALNEIEVYLTGKSAVLRGEVFSIDEAERIDFLRTHFPKQIQNETHLHIDLQKDAFQKVNAWINSLSIHSVQARLENGQIVLQGDFLLSLIHISEPTRPY